MNLSTLYRPFDLTPSWSGMMRRTTKAFVPAPGPSPLSGLSDLRRRLVVLHVAQATPTRPADERPSWPRISILCSLIVAALAIAAGAWQ